MKRFGNERFAAVSILVFVSVACGNGESSTDPQSNGGMSQSSSAQAPDRSREALSPLPASRASDAPPAASSDPSGVDAAPPDPYDYDAGPPASSIPPPPPTGLTLSSCPGYDAAPWDAGYDGYDAGPPPAPPPGLVGFSTKAEFEALFVGRWLRTSGSPSLQNEVDGIEFTADHAMYALRRASDGTFERLAPSTYGGGESWTIWFDDHCAGTELLYAHAADPVGVSYRSVPPVFFNGGSSLSFAYGWAPTYVRDGAQ